MNRRLVHLLFAVLLLCAQALAAAHAVEHTLSEAGKQGTPHHICELCVAAHDLGNALTGDVIAPPVVAADFIPAVFRQHGRAALPAPQARQQAPPFA